MAGKDYRKLAFETYDPVCAVCGFGIKDVLEVAHLDGNRFSMNSVASQMRLLMLEQAVVGSPC